MTPHPKLRKRLRGSDPLPARSASPAVQQLIQLIFDEGWSHQSICEAAGVHKSYIVHMSMGVRSPSIMNFEAVAQVCGYRIELVPIVDNSMSD